MKKILEKALCEAEEAEVYREEFQNTTVSFQSNRLKSLDNSFGEGIGLRVIKNGKIGFSSITNKEDADFLVKSAISSSSIGENAFFKFPPSPSKIPRVKCFDPDILSLPVEKMIDEGERTIKAILKEFPHLQCEAEIDKTIVKISILNSAGLSFSYKKTFYSFFIYAFQAQEGDFLGVGEENSSCKYHDWSEILVQKIVDKIKLSQKRATIEKGVYPVIFTSKAMPAIFSPLKRGINGKFVHKKVSPLFLKLNQKIVSPDLTIVDDATFPYARASSPVDGEGVPSRKTFIIENGVLKNFIYDLQTAGLMKTKTTANAARDYDSLPSPSTTNFIISPGEFSLEEMIKDIKEGLIVDQVIGAGQSNVLMGEFSVNLDLGFKVENGKIKGRIKDVMATGNVYELLSNIRGIGKEAIFVGSNYTPPFYFAKINIAA